LLDSGDFAEAKLQVSLAAQVSDRIVGGNMTNNPSINQNRSANIASILSPIISVVLAYTGATTPNITISFFLLAVLALLGIILVNDGHKLAALLYGVAFMVVASHLVYVFVLKPPLPAPPVEVSTDYEKYFELGMKPYNQGVETSNRERFVDALPNFQESVKIKPDFTKAVIYLGRCHLKLGNFEEACDSLQKAYKVAPAEVKGDLISLYVEWAKDLCRRGNKQRALRTISFLQSLDATIYAEAISRIGNC
jgi:tetratricopeptide (TPR) repeat protein